MSVEDDPAAPLLRGSGLHRLRRVATPEGWQVERRWHPDAHDELGADMHTEVAAQRLAAAHGLAPPVLDFDPRARTLRMPWVDGAPLEPDWTRSAVRRAAVAVLLARLRAVPAPGLPRLDLPQRVLALHRRLAARDTATAAAFAAEVAGAVEEGRRISGTVGLQSGTGSGAEAGVVREVCLVHGDLTPGNVMVRQDGSLLLLDWEYAHAGGPWDELAALCATADVTDAAGTGVHAGGPLADWAAAVPACARAGFEAMRRLRRLLDALWYALAERLVGVDGPQTGIRGRPEAH